MARYTGPMTRKSRRLKVDLVGGDQAFERRPYPPGQHGRIRIKETEYLLQILETRLDNVIYRAGLARTRRAARQLVTHGHFEVNGQRVDVPSYRVSQYDIITVREKSREQVLPIDLQPTEPSEMVETDVVEADRGMRVHAEQLGRPLGHGDRRVADADHAVTEDVAHRLGDHAGRVGEVHEDAAAAVGRHRHARGGAELPVVAAQ